MKPEEKSKGMLSAPAKIIVSLPADAKLTFDGVATKSTNAVRHFVTPELPAGETFQYTLTAEVVRDGQTMSVTEIVSVKAGQTTEITLTPKAVESVVSK